MGAKSSRENFRVVVYPRSPGDFGFASIGGQHRPEDETEAMCERIAAEIRRHVDEIPSRGSRGVHVEWDDVKTCAHCGADWLSEHDRHNNGCCAEDCDVMEAEATETS